MWIVKIALERPYTFIVLAFLILLLSPVVILNTPTDIFPNIDIPTAVAGMGSGSMSVSAGIRVSAVLKVVPPPTPDLLDDNILLSSSK